MCIRDRVVAAADAAILGAKADGVLLVIQAGRTRRDQSERCLLYTSDAADERSSVDLGGRRIIKKKNKHTERDESTQHKETSRTRQSSRTTQHDNRQEVVTQR